MTMEYGFLDQTLQQLRECLRSWEGERKLEFLVIDNSIWGDQPVWERQGHSLSAAQSVDSVSLAPSALGSASRPWS